MAENDEGNMSVREAGRKGGKTTRARYGPEFYQEIGQKGGKAVSERYSHEHFQKIGRKGGRKVEEVHMRLLHIPKEPPASAMYIFGRHIEEYNEWEPYISGW